jgi:hypothetical protein
MSDEFFQLNDNGTVDFGFGGITRTLARPTLGQYRRLLEKLGAARDSLVVDENDPDAKQPRIEEQFEKLLEWFDDLFKMLAGEGFPRNDDGSIDEDSVPSWIIASDVVTDLVKHWQVVPSRRGGQ